jgi:tetratricopeptide (TPR) repeat protein
MSSREYIEALITQITDASVSEAERLAAGIAPLAEWLGRTRGPLAQTLLAAKLRNEASIFLAQGKFAEAAARYRDSAENGDVSTMNELAWLLATCPDKDVRDGSKAVDYAQKACASTKRKLPNFLDTLAAAYAEAGQFEKAVATQQEAMGLLHSDQVKKDFATRLKLYQSNTPYRERAIP